jgi:hypothetical protein
MKARKIFPRLTPLVLAALLLNSPHASTAQRRRRPAPAPTPTTATQTTPTPAPSQPTTTPQSPAAMTTQPTPQASPARADAQARRAEAERTIEEMLSADGYGVYVEVRRVGTLARSEDLKTAVGMLGLVGADETQPLSDLFNFVSEDAEALAEARAVLAFLPTRPGLPQALVALELPTPESAAAFEPKFRRVIGQQYETVENALAGQPAPRAQVTTLKPASKEANDKVATVETGDKGAATQTTEKSTVAQKSATSEKGAANEKGVPGAASEKAAARESAQKSSGAQGFSVRRFGRLLVAGESPFTLRRLRGEEGGPSLSENARFQSVRARFASDSIFVYVDTTLVQQGYAVEQQRQQEAREAQAAGDKQTTAQHDVRVRKFEEPTAANSSTAATAANPSPSSSPTPEATTSATAVATTDQPATPPVTTPTNGAQTSTQASPAPQPSATTQTEAATSAQSAPSPSPTDEESAEAAQASARTVPSDAKIVVSRTDSASVAKPSEEQVSVQRMGGLLRGLWEGAPRIPGAVAVGLSLDSGSLALRVAVENTPDGVVSLVPFLPNLIAGPPVSADAAQVAPADSDIFLATSLDWTQIYNAALGSASLNPERLVASWETSEEGDAVASRPGAGERVPTPEEVVASVEKLFGFSFREDLLPALGNEVAVCVPLSEIIGSPFPRRVEEKKEGKDAEPGFVVIVSLNNPDKIREILPRVFAVLGVVPLGAPQPPPEKRQGFEIRSLGGPGGVSYAVVDNFLVLAEQVEHVRYVVDSYAARNTLAAQQSYRDSTEWQARQKLGEIYVSESLMRSTAERTKHDSGGSADPVVRMLLPQLDAEPRPASYQVTNEGDVLVHELRLPLSLLKTYVLSEIITMKDMSVINGERMTVYALNRIAEVEQVFKDEKKKGRYGTLEELVAEKLLEQDFASHLGYKIELNASGDHFEANATPKDYGKTGRRSFFVNEGGEVRGADHKGERATADDPPVN